MLLCRAFHSTFICNFLGFYLFAIFQCANPFNLDTSVTLIKRGSDGSYFGFSLAQHYISEGGANQHVVIVGAPRSNRTSTSIVEPGAVYKCPLSGQPNDCSALGVDETEIQGNDRSNQWLGVSVSSQNSSNSAVVCAHRLKRFGPAYVYGQGACYSLTNELTLQHEAFEACYNKPVLRAHEEYSLCQSGTSVTLDKNGNMLIGTPGALTWKGVLFLARPVSLEHHRITYFESESNINVPQDSYLGMAVRVAERMIGDGVSAYIGGAPKSKGSGEVLIFKHNNAQNMLELVRRVVGPKFYSGFGSDFIVGDFNGDGKDDLIVGAPFYHEQGISGAIYIYYNTPQWELSTRPIQITSRRMKDAECNRLNCVDARFGFSLANVGDLNKDGIQDFVVGAPFEGNGTIYVFQGSSKDNIKTYSQRITAEDVVGTRGPLKTFGYSLSGGKDVDSNTYPDLAVGAYQSASVVVLRTRPIVDITSTLKSNPKAINPKMTACHDGKPYACMDIEVCLRFTAEPKEKFTGKMTVAYRLEAEKFADSKIVRVFFGNSPENYYVDKSVSMIEQRQQQYLCVNNTAYLHNNNKDFLNPIAFRLTYTLPDSRPPVASAGQPMPELYSYPVLSPSSKDLQVSFIKNCGPDDICHSNLKLSTKLNLTPDSGGYLLKLGEDSDIRLQVNVTNFGEDAHETVLYIRLPDKVGLIGTESGNKGISCIPEDNVLHCELGNPLPEKDTVSLVIRLDPNKIGSDQSKLQLEVLVNTTSVENVTSDDRMLFNINVVTFVDLSVIGTSDPRSVYYSSRDEGKQEGNITDEAQIGPEILYKFEVKNNGRVSVSKSILTITWPYKLVGSTTSPSYLLYIMERPKVAGNTLEVEGARCSIEEKYINPTNVKIKAASDPDAIQTNAKDGNGSRRKRRSTAGYEAGLGDWVCGSSSGIECVSIVCNVQELNRGESALVSIRARLWNRTMSSTFPDANDVLARTTAAISFDQTSASIRDQNTANNYAQATTKIVNAAYKATQTPIWIIIVSVIAGILLLIILIVILWKVGFFKRKRADFPSFQAQVQPSAESKEQLTVNESSADH